MIVGVRWSVEPSRTAIRDACRVGTTSKDSCPQASRTGRKPKRPNLVGPRARARPELVVGRVGTTAWRAWAAHFHQVF